MSIGAVYEMEEIVPYLLLYFSILIGIKSNIHL